jgi:hypothetical protein
VIKTTGFVLEGLVLPRFMKKLASILLLLVYGLSSSGMTLRLDYCCGKLDKIEFSPLAVKQDGINHSMGKRSCCESKQIEFKLKADQKAEQANKLISPTPAIVKGNAGIFISRSLSSRETVPEILTPPPLKTPLHISHCMYRI